MKQLFAFILFATPLVWSPGPVNILLAGLGANHGIRKNLTFVSGLICSATVISIACLFGFQLVLLNDIVHFWLVVAGSLYIMYLAFKLYRLQPDTIKKNEVTHNFTDGVFVTLLNPKFYVMVAAIFSQFIDPHKSNGLAVCAGFVIILLMAHIAWLSVGKALADTTKSARHIGLLNKIMGGSLFLFATYFLYHAWS